METQHPYVQLAEIEAAIRRFPSVQEAVIQIEDAGTNKRLVAYLVPTVAVRSPSFIGDLRRFLEERLPQRMLPAAFVLLDALPRTDDGQVDQRALAAHLRSQSPTQGASQAAAPIQVSAPEQDLSTRQAQLLERRARLSTGRQALLDKVRRDLLEKRSQAQTTALPLAFTITKRPASNEAPLSFAQQRMWFLDQLAPDLAINNIANAIRLRGQLDLLALKQSLSEITRRHEALRAIFIAVNGQPVQIIESAAPVQLPVVELEDWPDAERETEAKRWAMQEARRLFNLAEGPLARFILLRLSSQEHILLLTMHHIVSDGWSIGVFTRELEPLYKAFTTGQPSPLPELPIQYSDFAYWQREWLQGETLEAQLTYWKQQLDNSPAILELSTDRPRPTVQTFEGDWQPLTLSRPLIEAIKNLGQQEDVTLFMTLLAAFKVLLYRYTGQEDILMGSPIANRTRTETEGLIGLFVNTLVLRTRLSGDLSFRALLSSVRQTTLEAYAHQDLPFEKLVAELQPERSLSHTPLFQVMFVLHNPPTKDLRLPGLTLDHIESDSKTAQFDLTLFTQETTRGLIASLQYNTDLFDAATITRMLGHFQTLLEGILPDPERRLSDLPLLTAAERQQLLIEWNRTEADYSRDKCLHELFEEQVERTPDAIALVFSSTDPGHGEDESLTYRQLNRRANQLGHYLRTLGVGPETCVAICMKRSVEMVVGIYGTLKAGGAYVPLDPAYPLERLSFMCQDAQAKIVLTLSPLASMLSSFSQMICLDADEGLVAGQSQMDPASEVTPTNLAYVIYTSGSTGKPKGVAVTHRNAAALAAWAGQVFTPQDRSGVLASTSICFDLSIFELLATLCQGGQVILVENALHLPTLPARERVTLINTVPSVMTELMHMGGMPASEHTVTLAGEPLKSALVQQIYRQETIQRVYNLYGPSEDTTYSTFALIGKSNDALPPIGRPIANSQVYLLDAYLQPVPVGVPGGLYMGGEGVARCYLNRPELTAERFIPDPFLPPQAKGDIVRGTRLYKTGDLARYLPDGSLEFIGRIDYQVKVRGFRIELGEIETILEQHPAVRQALVMAREDAPGSQRLVAYLVLTARDERAAGADRSSPVIADLRRFVMNKLPDYMAPSTFVLLTEGMPLTPSGKVDRRALPAPDRSRPDLEEQFAPPTTAVEELLSGIWAQVLGVKQIGRLDNFFELGGHSLLATQVISRIRSAFQVELPLRSLFEAPTISDMAPRIEAARQATQGLVLPILPAHRDRALPLSFSQDRLWFLDQLEPGNPAYNIVGVIRLQGFLDVPVMEQSLCEIVRRHQALRTTFASVDGKPVQVVAPAYPDEQSAHTMLPVIDLQGLAETEREAWALSLIDQESRWSFDLARGPLFRTALLRLNAEEHVLLLNMHHIVSDGWSLGIFFRELAVLYKAFITQKPSPLPELAIQYADFAVWQRQWLQGQILETQLAYWKRQFSDDPPILELPTDRPRPVVQTFGGATESLTLSSTLTEALQVLSQREGITLFMTLLAAFKVLLHRYTGQEDICVGSYIANRNRAETEGLIGYFINTLALRTDLSGQPTFRELAARVRQVTLEAYAHQDLPFEKLLEVLQPKRDLSRTPLFQVACVLQNTPKTLFRLPGLRLKSVPLEKRRANFDLTLWITEETQGLDLELEYNTDLFDVTTIIRMLAHLQTLLENIILNPDQRLSDLEILTGDEQRQLLVDWAGASAAHSQNICVHQLWEAQVERTPDAAALLSAPCLLTVQELNRQANQLAHYLRALGVGPEVPVGICAERSPEMIVGILGILKAGGAYLPLDPTFPKERLSFMLRDAQAPVLLTQERLIGILPEHTARVVCLDAGWETIAQESKENPANSVTAENPAYLIYTSGSTGKPKGVVVQHRSLVSFTESVILGWKLDSSDRILQFASISWDTSAEEIYPCLTQGATLVLRTPEMLDSPDTFLKKCHDWAITVLNLPTAYWHELAANLDASSAASASSLRLLIIGGEKALGDRLALWQQHIGQCVRLMNTYGSTETTAITTMCALAGSTKTDRVPIGRPISNVLTYVLDRRLQPVPFGVPGELCVGGAGLARGYLNWPGPTAEKFIPRPYGHEPGARLYKTGDSARYLPDGNIEFLGRIDQQIKIRGVRVEPGEVETALREYPAVREAVVAARQDGLGQNRLVAYVVPDSTRAAAGDQRPVNDAAAQQEASPLLRPAQLIGDVRNFLRARLPDYWIPSAFVLLDALPLTPSGKIDRRALPAPDSTRPELEERFAAPRSPVEQVLAGIWADVLELNRVGIYDDFFELGGHSLLATQVVSRVRSAFRVDLALRSLFESPTVAGLAERIETAMQSRSGSQAPPLVPAQQKVGAEEELSFAQQRLWFLDRLLPGSSAYNIPAALRLKGPLDAAALEQSLCEIVRRHATLRTTFKLVEGHPVQVITEKGATNIPIIDLSNLPASELEPCSLQLANIEIRRPFDLANGPLLRIILLQLGERDHALVLTIHHIISDDWSIGVLVRELTALYAAFAAGKPSPLPDLPVQYTDFARWQREWLRDEVLETQLAYWRQQLGRNLPVTELPTDRPRPPIQTFDGARQSMLFPKPLSLALQALSRQERVTLFMTLLAAFQTLLYRYTGQDDIVVGSPIAGRNRAEIEGLIGFFVNTLVLRTDLSGNPSFQELLNRVREVALGAYTHQDLPLEKLVEELHPERDPSRQPLFQVVFALQNAPAPDPELAGLTLGSVAIDRGTTQFDLVLSMADTEHGLFTAFDYNTGLFDAPTITRLARHFQTLLEGIVVHPDQRLSGLPLLTETENRQLLVRWNDTRTDYPQDKCIHLLFEAQAEQIPDAIALVFEQQALTYRELNERANRIARHLSALGVGPEVLVGICTERSLDTIIGLLGILKAGGAFVPFDPAYPKERLAFMLKDTQAAVLIVERRLLERLPDHTAQVVCLDAFDSRPESQDEQPATGGSDSPICTTTAESLAYVMYTSGSTGIPKGVAVTHRNVVRLVRESHYASLTSEQVFLQFAPISFDASTFEIWGCLLNGARLVVFSAHTLSLDELGQSLQQHRITTLWLTAGLFHQMVEEQLESLQYVQELLAGGDVLSVPHVQKVMRQIRGPLINGYGPTECTTFTCCYRATALDQVGNSVSIGRPIANTQIYVLDGHLNPAPIGVPGELYIGGDGLARGYLNHPDLTAAKFIPNPFILSNPPMQAEVDAGGGARLYKTGDLVRYLPDGNIEFIGRNDFQVKIRGFRIELGEIEAALSQHPSVREMVVVARENTSGDKRLIAYIVPNQSPAPPPYELRRFLEEKLPKYMAPSAIVFLDALPLDPNGKIDRQALPEPEGVRPEMETAYLAPRTELERMIAAVWQEVLQVEKVGMYDNFFDLGGHSLLLIKAHSRLKEVCKQELSMIDMFTYPTVSALAEHLSQAAKSRPSLLPGDDRTDKITEGKDRLRQRLQRRQRSAT